MNKEEYEKLYQFFKQTGQVESILIQEYLYDVGKKFDLNEFFKALQILQNPFSMMNPNLQKYSGIDFQQIMVDKCFEHFDTKFDIQRYDLSFGQIKDKRLLKNLLQRFPQGIIHF